MTYVIADIYCTYFSVFRSHLGIANLPRNLPLGTGSPARKTLKAALLQIQQAEEIGDSYLSFTSQRSRGTQNERSLMFVDEGVLV